MQGHIDAVRSRLLDGVKLSGIARSQQTNIIRSAQQRSLEVSHRIDELRGGQAITDRDSSQEYQSLLDEQGRLNAILSFANYPG